MTEAKHTPGPWAVKADDHLWVVTDWALPSNMGIDYICRTSTWETDYPEAEANARLIAAAPELLEALEKAVHDYGKPGGPWNVPDEPGSWIALARASIAKAKGE